MDNFNDEQKKEIFGKVYQAYDTGNKEILLKKKEEFQKKKNLRDSATQKELTIIVREDLRKKLDLY